MDTVCKTIEYSFSSLVDSWLHPLRSLISHFDPHPFGQRPPPEHDLDNHTNIRADLSLEDVRVVPFHDGANLYYLLEPRSESQIRTIMVRDAAMTLQVLRSLWGHTTLAIAQNLTRRGIAFKTLIPLPPFWAAIPGSPWPIVGLGWRRPNYTPDVFEFYAYEAKRDLFLRINPHARAALLYGGIIWRLVTDALEFGPAYDGPSEDVYTYGSRHFSQLGSFCDDQLSEDELDLICGVYRVYTGKLYRTSVLLFLLIFHSRSRLSDRRYVMVAQTSSMGKFWP